MNEHSCKLSLASTNTASSDDEENRLHKLAPPSPKSQPALRTRSLSASGPDMLQTEDKDYPFHTRRASLPLDLDTGYERRFRIPAARLSEIAYEEKAREGLMGNQMLDDIALLARSYLDTHPSSELHSEVIPEENQVREDLDLNPFTVVKDDLEDTIIPSPWNTSELELEVPDTIEEEGEDIQDEFVINHENLYKELDRKIEESNSSKQSAMRRVSDSIQEQEQEDEVTLKHDKFMHKIAQNDEKYLENNEDRISSSLHEVTEVEEPPTGGSVI